MPGVDGGWSGVDGGLFDRVMVWKSCWIGCDERKGGNGDCKW